MAQKQHVDIHRKLKLREMILGKLPIKGACYVPFIGDGDIASELYKSWTIFGADLDEARVVTAREKLQGATIKTTDCEQWPFPHISEPFVMADFDAYNNPYRSFIAFWENANKADTMALFLTDGLRRAAIRSGKVYDFAIHDYKDSEQTLASRRAALNFWLPRSVLPWFQNYIKPYQVIDLKFYTRQMQLYWGCLVSKVLEGKLDKGTLEKVAGAINGRKGLFLQSLASGHSVKFACNDLGLVRQTVYKWRDKDERFALAWDAAVDEGGDLYEDYLHDAAEAGNVTAIIVGLKMRGRFTERQEVEHSGNAEKPITLRVVYDDSGQK